MKVGDVSDVLRTPRGLSDPEARMLDAGETMPFEQAREQISERVFTDKRTGGVREVPRKLRSQAIIEWKNQEIKKAFERGLSRRRQPPASR